MRGIAIREELTDEWDKRGIKVQREYAILTAEISKATFGMTLSEYKEHKGLERENLRDHMTDLELIFSQFLTWTQLHLTQFYLFDKSSIEVRFTKSGKCHPRETASIGTVFFTLFFRSLSAITSRFFYMSGATGL